MSSSNKPDFQYYDLMVSNLNNTTATLPQPLTFIETRTIPFLHNPKEYCMSITRFSLSTQALPVILPTIIPYSTNINETIYRVSMSYVWTDPDTNIRYEFVNTEKILFAPQNLSASTPVPPSLTPDGLQDNSTGYYNVYSYQYFVGIINYSISKCYSDLLAIIQANSSAYASIPTSALSQPPILLFDTTVNLATLNVPATQGSGSGNLWGTYNPNVLLAPLNNQFRMYFNTGLFSLFSSLPALNSLGYTYTSGNTTYTNTDMTNQIIIPSDSTLFPTVNMPIGASASVQYPCYPIVQEYSTVNSWSPVSSIVFTSNTLPIISNQLSNPVVYVNNSLVTLTTAGANFGQIITDFQSSNFKIDDVVIYNPTAEYRRIQMIGDRPLYTVDVNVFWLDKTTQKLLPFYLLAGGSFSMKILFQKIIPT